MQKHIHELTQREMTRKEFLITMGFGLSSILGISVILRLLGVKPFGQPIRRSGYGSSSYGGTRGSS